MSSNAFIPSCPRLPLPVSMTMADCLVNWANISRVVIMKKNGTDPFADIDAATQEANIVDETKWTDAISAADPDNIVLSTKTQLSTLTAGEPTTEELENQDVIWTGQVGFSLMELTFKGLTSEDEAKLIKWQGDGIRVCFIFKDGKSLMCDVSAGTGDENTFFDCILLTFSGRNHETGSVGDSNIMRIWFQQENLLNWKIYDTSAFGLVI